VDVFGVGAGEAEGSALVVVVEGGVDRRVQLSV